MLEYDGLECLKAEFHQSFSQSKSKKKKKKKTPVDLGDKTLQNK